MMKIAIAGATGRMGKMLIEALLNTPDTQLAGALEHSSCLNWVMMLDLFWVKKQVS